MRLRIHPLTVDKAYKQLQSEGLITTNHGKGSCISAKAGELAEGYRHDSLAQAVDELIADGINLGLKLEQIRTLFAARLSEAKTKQRETMLEEYDHGDE